MQYIQAILALKYFWQQIDKLIIQPLKAWFNANEQKKVDDVYKETVDTAETTGTKIEVLGNQADSDENDLEMIKAHKERHKKGEV